MRIITYLAIGLGMFAFFRLSNVLLQSRAARQKSIKTILRIFPFIELIGWAIFLLWLMKGLFSQWEGYTLMMIILIVILFLTTGWYFLRDFVAGVILKAESAFTVGQQISTDEISGTIKKVGYRSLELESEMGQFSKVPYSRLSSRIFSIQAPAESVLSHDIVLEISDASEIDKLKEQIIKELLLLPWVSVNHTPEIKIIQEQGGSLQIKISYHTSNDSQASAINQHIRKRFEGK